ncbi:RNA-directed DNA polymerase, eukaryota, reverse transcriptase zinc-binding domain protein [Tanacetum coccineum]
MVRGFLSQKRSRGGRGVKEKSLNRNSMNTSSGIGVSTGSDDTMNEDTPVGVASAVKEGVTPSLVDIMVENKKVSALEDNTVSESFPPLTTPVTTTADNAHGISSYANITSKLSGKKVKVRTLFTPRGNGIDVVFPVDSIRAISYYSSLSGIATKLGTPLMFDSYTSDMCIQSWGRSSYARVMIELRADVELKDNIVVAMPKITREGHYTCNVHVEYEWKPPRCSSCKVFGHVHEECPKNTGAGQKKTMKKPSQTSRGISIGSKIGFKPQNEYRPVLKKSTASPSGNKKKVVEPTIKVSNSNSFDVLNLVDNDVESGTNRGTPNLVNNGATSSRSSFMSVDNSSSSTIPNIDKIEKFEDFLTNGQAILVDKTGNSLKKVQFLGFGTQSLLEQWRDSYGNCNYDDDPYDDKMYEGHDLSHELQAICNNLDICVRGRKKK